MKSNFNLSTDSVTQSEQDQSGHSFCDIQFSSQSGFTLVEAIVAMVVFGIAAALIGMFIRFPIQSYFDTERRARLTDRADTALRRMTRDLRLALPNSVRVMQDGTTQYLEFFQTRAGGRYRMEPAAGGSGGNLDALDFTATDVSFQIIGTAPAYISGDYVAITNLGPDSGADAYNGDNIAEVKSVDSSSGVLTLKSGFRFPVPSPGNRFFIVDSRVTYRCDPSTGELRRYWGYSMPPVPANKNQAVPPVTAASALLATGVTACTITYDSNVSNTRSAIVSILLTLADAQVPQEAVSLFHQVHVSNVP